MLWKHKRGRESWEIPASRSPGPVPARRRGQKEGKCTKLTTIIASYQKLPTTTESTTWSTKSITSSPARITSGTHPKGALLSEKTGKASRDDSDFSFGHHSSAEEIPARWKCTRLCTHLTKFDGKHRIWGNGAWFWKVKTKVPQAEEDRDESATERASKRRKTRRTSPTPLSSAMYRGRSYLIDVDKPPIDLEDDGSDNDGVVMAGSHYMFILSPIFVTLLLLDQKEL